MKAIEIQPNETLAEVQQNFSAVFPNLKIEFFNHSHKSGEGNTKADLITNLNMTLNELGDVKEELQISVDGHKKVQTLENDFAEHNISIQVFRRSGKVWLQTTTSDNWTLAQQNKEAELTL